MKENLYTKLVNHLSIGAAIMSSDGRTIFMNEQFRRSIGENEDFIYSADLFSSEYLKKISTSVYIKTLKERKEVRSNQFYINEDKMLYNIMLRDVPILSEENEVEAVLACAEYILPMGYADDFSGVFHRDSKSHLVYRSEMMKEIIKRINRVAVLPINVLLIGESGVGKDKMAEYIHEVSERKDKPFVVVNCAAIAENLAESELFGYVGGAFTGAGRGGKKGLIEEADGGTLFLDEINSLPMGLQGKILRAIENKKIRRVGSAEEKNVDFRLIAASNRDLKECVENKTFREDLYYRISVYTENIPPLRERTDDIVPLLTFFIESLSLKYNVRYRLSKEDVQLAMNYQWPGNVRELRNYAEQIAVIGHSPIMKGGDRDNSLKIRGTGTLKSQLVACEKRIIQEALKNNLSKKSAAQELGIDPSILSRKIKGFDL